MVKRLRAIPLGETPYGTLYAIDRRRPKFFNPKLDSFTLEAASVSIEDMEMAKRFLGLDQIHFKKADYKALQLYTLAMQQTSEMASQGKIDETKKSLEQAENLFQILHHDESLLSHSHLIEQSAQQYIQNLLDQAQDLAQQGLWEQIEDLQDLAWQIGTEHLVDDHFEEFDEYRQQAFDNWMFSELR